MNRAVGLGQQPGAKESISYLKNMEANGYTAPPPPPPLSRIEVSQMSKLSINTFFIIFSINSLPFHFCIFIKNQ